MISALFWVVINSKVCAVVHDRNIKLDLSNPHSAHHFWPTHVPRSVHSSVSTVLCRKELPCKLVLTASYVAVHEYKGPTIICVQGATIDTRIHGSHVNAPKGLSFFA